jgi:hypothetical protein
VFAVSEVAVGLWPGETGDANGLATASRRTELIPFRLFETQIDNRPPFEAAPSFAASFHNKGIGNGMNSVLRLLNAALTKPARWFVREILDR